MPDAHGAVWVNASGGGQSKVVHTSPGCPNLGRAAKMRKVDRQVYPNRDVCGRCLGGIDYSPKSPRNGASDAEDTCGTCHGSLTAEDHTACVCDALDRLHDVPRDATFCPVGGYPHA